MEHYFLKCVADALFYLFETTIIEMIVEDFADMSDTGGYLSFLFVYRFSYH